jgi:hypothetical protein
VLRSPPVHRWLLLLVFLAAASCRDSGTDPPVTTMLLPETTVTQPATTTTLGFEIPAVIDLPYVQRVLETIYHLDGEATRHAYAKKTVDAELYERLEAIFGGEALEESKRILGENAAEGFAVFANPPGDPKVRAVEVLQATTKCIVVRADLDFGPYYKDQRPPPTQSLIQLAPADVLPLNPTRWGILVAGQPRPGTNTRVCQ